MYFYKSMPIFQIVQIYITFLVMFTSFSTRIYHILFFLYEIIQNKSLSIQLSIFYDIMYVSYYNISYHYQNSFYFKEALYV